MQRIRWPGNIRELESTVSRAALSAPGRVIRDGDIEFLRTRGSRCLSRTVLRACRRCVTPSGRISSRVLDAVSWNKKEAARVLEISRGTRSIERSWIQPRTGDENVPQQNTRVEHPVLS